MVNSGCIFKNIVGEREASEGDLRIVRSVLRKPRDAWKHNVFGFGIEEKVDFNFSVRD